MPRHLIPLVTSAGCLLCAMFAVGQTDRRPRSDLIDELIPERPGLSQGTRERLFRWNIESTYRNRGTKMSSDWDGRIDRAICECFERRDPRPPERERAYKAVMERQSLNCVGWMGHLLEVEGRDDGRYDALLRFVPHFTSLRGGIPYTDRGCTELWVYDPGRDTLRMLECQPEEGMHFFFRD